MGEVGKVLVGLGERRFEHRFGGNAAVGPEIREDNVGDFFKGGCFGFPLHVGQLEDNEKVKGGGEFFFVQDQGTLFVLGRTEVDLVYLCFELVHKSDLLY